MTLPDVQAFLYEVTAFGDVELIAPTVCGVATAFWLVGAKRNAMNFFGAFVLCLALVVVAKIGLMLIWRGGPLRSPSGHSAVSAYFYGSIGLMLLASSRGFFARLLAVALAAFAVLIAISRFEIGGHSRTEALIGLALGASCALFFRSRFTRLKWPGAAPAALACIVALAVTGALWQLLAPGYVDEESIADFARWLRGFLRTA